MFARTKASVGVLSQTCCDRHKLGSSKSSNRDAPFCALTSRMGGASSTSVRT
jgi:hypothetical protein